MSITRYRFLLRLRCCWCLLTARAWLLYVPEPPRPPEHPYRATWRGLHTSDLDNLRHWCAETDDDVRGQRAALDTLLTLNPGIAPAPDA